MDKVNKNLLSTSQAAKLLKVSRIAVFKKIKTGELEAVKVGRNYVITREALEGYKNPITQVGLTENSKKIIDDSVKRTVKEYGETLRLLGKEDLRK